MENFLTNFWFTVSVNIDDDDMINTPALQFNRQIVKQRRKTMSKNEVYYASPCGRRLRDIEEVFRYLRETESNLEIDCFTFELSIDVSHEWEPYKKIVHLEVRIKFKS